LSFFDAFRKTARFHYSKVFLSQGNQSITFGEALRRVEKSTENNAARVALVSNSLESVLGWLYLEMTRNTYSDLEIDLAKSSGSTGEPKIFHIPIDAQILTASAINEEILGHQKLNEVIVLPLSHSSARGRLRAAVLRGASIALAEHPFTFSSIRHALESHQQFSMATTPSTHRYLDQRLSGQFWSVFNGLLSLEFGSAPLRESEQSKILASSPDEVELKMHFGLSEASRSFLRDIRMTAWNEVGTPMPHAKYRLEGDGELVISGPHTADELRSRGISHPIEEVKTGDICALDDSGKLLLLGRKKNTINLGGITLFAELLESQLSAIIGGTSVYIARTQHEMLGEAPVLIGAGGSKQHILKAWDIVARPLGVTFRPSVVLADEIPLLASGKVDRMKLNALALQSVDC
jgi:acyl-CoA synthetase (AMP-forming)/AMP-acid ligase II